MFPMVCGLEDWRRAHAVLEEARGELAERRQPFNERLQVGVMVEIPSAVFMADELAAEVDFMSIGTNDLTQYLLAADRMNEHVSAYYRPFHPAVIRAIHRVVEAAHRRGKWVGVCGELAGMPLAIPVLMGMGVDELSMSPRSLPEVRHVILGTKYSQAQSLAQNVLTIKDTDALEAEIRRNFAKE
jgi:phosphotransferase system enzyme I (PtsI)